MYTQRRSTYAYLRMCDADADDDDVWPYESKHTAALYTI